MDIHKLIATINPDVFCKRKARSEVKRILQERLAAGDRLGYLKAAAKTDPAEPNQIAFERLVEINPFKLPGQRSPSERHILALDRGGEALEPVYFGLLQELEQHWEGRVTKVVDTFTATIGAGVGADLTRRMLQLQEHSAKVVARIHTRVRVLLRLWQEWQEGKRSLIAYEQARAYGGEEGRRAREALENQWRRRDNSSRFDGGVPTTVPFQAWLEHSESELRRRLEIERHLLASELRLLKLETEWVKPYLRQPDEGPRLDDPSLVNAFNTAVFEVVLLVELPWDLERSVERGDLPKMLLGRKYRRPTPVLVIEMRFRAIPERGSPGSHVYRGRVEMAFTSYALSADELSVLRREVRREQYGEVVSGLEAESSQGFHELLAELDQLLAEGTEAPAGKQPRSGDVNPFAALFSIADWFRTPAAATNESAIQEPLHPDCDVEQVLRSCALLEARQACLEIYEHEKQRLLQPYPGFI